MFEALGVINPGMFFIGTVIIILAPGPNSLYVLATAIRRGVRDGYKAAAAVVVGDGVLMFMAATGAGSLLRLYPVAFVALQYAGAAYLGYLGLRVLYGVIRCKDGQSGETGECKREDPFYRALALSLSNPKAILFFVSFFVQFVDPAKGHPAMAFFVLACVVQSVSITYLSVLIFGGSRLIGVVRGNRVLQRAGRAAMGLTFFGFGCRLAVRAATF